MAIDKNTFESIFRLYFSSLCVFAGKYIRDTDTAREIVHDVFINLWDKRDTIEPDKAVKSYLFTSVHNRCLNSIRNNKKFVKDEITLIQIDEIENVSDQMVESELESKIKFLIDSLPDKCREIFMMSRYDNLKYSEIAEKLGIAVKTVEAQMSKALKYLRDNLQDYLTLILLIVNYFFNWYRGGSNF